MFQLLAKNQKREGKEDRKGYHRKFKWSSENLHQLHQFHLLCCLFVQTLQFYNHFSHRHDTFTSSIGRGWPNGHTLKHKLSGMNIYQQKFCGGRLATTNGDILLVCICKIVATVATVATLCRCAYPVADQPYPETQIINQSFHHSWHRG